MKHLGAPEALPRLLGAADAARYLGISEGTLVKLGLPRRVLGARRLYDRRDLDDYADGLPVEGGESGEVSACDSIFGARE